MKQVWFNNFSTKLIRSAGSDSTAIELEEYPPLNFSEWCYLTLEASVGGNRRVEVIAVTNSEQSGYVFERGKQGESHDFPAYTIAECRATAGDFSKMNDPFTAVHR